MTSCCRPAVLLLSFFLLLPGCSLTRRGVMEGNVYFSTKSPNVKISISEGFNYQKSSSGPPQHQFVEEEKHRFVYIHHIKHAANENIIDYFNNPEHWIYISSSDDVYIKRFTMDMVREKWYVQDFVNHPSSASCLFVRQLSTFTSWHDLLHVLYVWEIPPYTCSDWKSADSLRDSQQEYIEAFRRGFTEDVQIEEYTEKEL